jgi:hypothetical protein
MKRNVQCNFRYGAPRFSYTPLNVKHNTQIFHPAFHLMLWSVSYLTMCPHFVHPLYSWPFDELHILCSVSVSSIAVFHYWICILHFCILFALSCYNWNNKPKDTQLYLFPEVQGDTVWYLAFRSARSVKRDALQSHSCLQNGHNNVFVFLSQARLWMLQSTQLRPKWTWPLTVIFTSCDWRIKSRTNISWNFLCVIFPSHDLCNRYAFRIVISRRRKNNFFAHFHVLRAMP